ncbi:MAG: hypothetical protein ACT4QC_07480 [Planctomycetaceae bacterium]
MLIAAALTLTIALRDGAVAQNKKPLASSLDDVAVAQNKKPDPAALPRRVGHGMITGVVDPASLENLPGGFGGMLSSMMGGAGTMGGVGQADPLVLQDMVLEQQVNKHVSAFMSADSDDSRAAARAALTGMLKEQFVIRQQRREKEIAEIEERVKRLREALDKRAEAKEKIIERRLTQLLSDAEGLGWGEAGGPVNAGGGSESVEFQGGPKPAGPRSGTRNPSSR